MHTLLWYTIFVCLAVFFHERSIFMPGFTTHYLFGVETCHRLGASPLRRELMENHTSFGLGLQGPDIFFYDLPSYVIYKNNIGSVAHTTDTGKFLFFLLQSRFLFPKNVRSRRAILPALSGIIFSTPPATLMYTTARKAARTVPPLSRRMYIWKPTLIPRFCAIIKKCFLRNSIRSAPSL